MFLVARERRVLQIRGSRVFSAGGSKWPSSKARRTKAPERTLVREDAERLRTPLAVFLSLLLDSTSSRPQGEGPEDAVLFASAAEGS